MAKCTPENKKNLGRLDPLLFPITYGSTSLINNLCLPRKYTSTHNDATREIYLSIGHLYNSSLLSSEEVVKNQTQVIGKWVRAKSEYQIHLRILVSTPENPNAALRNAIFCSELGVVLEGIALAESALLISHPELAHSKILVYFKSIDPTYNRVEYWHRLGYWAPKSVQSQIGFNRHNKNKKKNKILQSISDHPKVTLLNFNKTKEYKPLNIIADLPSDLDPNDSVYQPDLSKECSSCMRE